MNIKKFVAISIIVILTLILLLGLILTFMKGIIERNNKNAYTEGYLQCAKDFYQGKVQADLVKQENGEVIWQYNED